MPTLHRLTLAAALVIAACSSAAMPEVTGDAGPPTQLDATTPAPDVMAPQATEFELGLSTDKLPVLQGPGLRHRGQGDHQLEGQRRPRLDLRAGAADGGR